MSLADDKHNDDREKKADDDESNDSDYSESGSGSGSEYEEIDVTDNPLYQVLSAFLENEEGENICDILKDLSLAVKENNKLFAKMLKQKKPEK